MFRFCSTALSDTTTAMRKQRFVETVPGMVKATASRTSITLPIGSLLAIVGGLLATILLTGLQSSSQTYAWIRMSSLTGDMALALPAHTQVTFLSPQSRAQMTIAPPAHFPTVSEPPPDACPGISVNEDAFIAAAKACQAAVKQAVLPALDALAAAVPGAALHTVLDLWSSVLARGAPGNWLEAGSTAGAATVLAAALQAAADKSPQCIHKHQRVIQLMTDRPEQLTAGVQQHSIVVLTNGTMKGAIAPASLAMLVVGLNDSFADEADALLGYTYQLAAPASAMVLDGHGLCRKCGDVVDQFLQHQLGFVPTLEKTGPNGVWLLKPVKEALTTPGIQDLLLHASFKAMQLSNGAHSFVGMGHSFECPMQAAFLRNAATYRGVRHVCEVGFNAGHGTISALATNPTLTMTNFDLGELPWSKGMAAFVNQLFPGRFEYIKGNSFQAVPEYAARVLEASAPACNMFIIDGDHSFEGTQLDFGNAMEACAPNAYLIADDYTVNFPGVVKSWEAMVSKGQVEELLCQQTRERYRGYQKGWCLGRIQGKEPPPAKTHIHVATAQCGSHLDMLLELEMLLKTALMSADPLDYIHLHAVLGKMDDATGAAFKARLQGIAANMTGVFELHLYDPYPDIIDLFKPCSTQSLSIHKLIPDDVECALFLDRDSAVLGSLNGFNDIACMLGDRLMAMAEEAGYWYVVNHGPQKVNTTYVGPTGVNGGILGLNLKKQRAVDFAGVVAGLYTDYKSKGYNLQLGDQDILNAYFADNPQLLQKIDCMYNTRIVDYQVNSCECCPPGGVGDAVVLHGNRRVFHECCLHGNLWRPRLGMLSRYHGQLLLSLQSSGAKTYMREYCNILGAHC